MFNLKAESDLRLFESNPNYIRPILSLTRNKMVDFFESLYLHRNEIEFEMTKIEELCTEINDLEGKDQSRIKALRSSMKVRDKNF